MKFNQIGLLAAAALLIPTGATIASLATGPATATGTAQTIIAQATESEAVQTAEPSTERLARHHRRGKRKWCSRMLRDLGQIGVDAERLDTIKDICEATKAEMKDMRPEMRAARQKMHELYASDASNSELRAQYELMKDLKEQKRDKRFEASLKIREQLTVEERQQLQELRKERRERRRGRRREGRQNRRQGPGAQLGEAMS